MLLKKLFFGLLLSCFFLFGCTKNDIVGLSEIITETPDRTVLLYIVGDNDLTKFVDANVASVMAGMQAVPTTLNMLVYQDNHSSDGQGNMTAPTLYRVTYEYGQATRQVVKTYEEQNSIDSEVMQGVIRDAFSAYPSSEKGLIFWSHGSGWLPKSKASVPIQYSYGPDNYQYLDIWELRPILEETGIQFDFITFDACNMAAVEVAYELRNVSKYTILSPTEIMGVGFPYQYMVPVLAKKDLDLQALCQAYMQFYDGMNSRDGAITLIESAKLEGLADLYASFLASYGETINQSNTTEIQQYGRRSKGTYNVFFDMASVAETFMPDDLYSPFLTQYNKVVLYHDNTPSFIEIVINQGSGLSVFLPQVNTNTYYKDSYNALQWTQRMNQ